MVSAAATNTEPPAALDRDAAAPRGPSSTSRGGGDVAVRVSEFAPLVLAVAYVLMCPYTKVEESFNMQATHDLLFHGTDLDSYDHHSFPGVVPRTFIGALALAAGALPASLVLRAAGAPRHASQVAVRCVLALFVWMAFIRFKRAFAGPRAFGRDAGIMLVVITCAQFHFLFYASRTLPNTFAVLLVLLASADWIESKWRRSVMLLVMAVIWFRCDVLVLLGPVLFSMLQTRKVKLVPLIGWGIVCGVVALAATIAIDSLFWRRLLWPEGEVLWFNTVQNKSHQWGVMSWHWYFSSALPRALLAGIPLIAAGMLTRVNPWPSSRLHIGLDRRIAEYAVPALLFVLLYSWLPHKELRFVMPAVALLNATAAYGAAKLYGMRHKTRYPAVALLSLVLGSLLASGVFLQASLQNYPGGEAFAWLHANEAPPHVTATRAGGGGGGGGAAQAWVHIDAQPAMAGVTRFGEHGDPWRYSKDEALEAAADFDRFDYLLTPDADKHSERFEVLHTAHVFAGLNVRALRPPAGSDGGGGGSAGREALLTTTPHTYVMRHRRHTAADRSRDA